MTALRIALCALLMLLLTACGGGGGGTVASTSGIAGNAGLSNPPTGSNVVPVSVDAGDAAIEPSGAFYPDVPYTTVKVCVPGTSHCATIDHVEVDTGSSGLRLMAASLGTLGSELPAESSGSQQFAECLPFVESYSWGSVRTVDLYVGGETAHAVPVQIIGDATYSVPAACSSSGLTASNTPQSFGANGLIGIGNLAYDCGADCASSSQSGYYYLCTPGAAGSCTEATAPLADQLPNPITRFEADSSGIADNNGSLITLPALPVAGADTASGVLVFGIGTRANNGLGSATVHLLDALGNMQTTYKGTDYSASYVDSGTGDLEIPDDSIPACARSSSAYGYSCPATTLDLQATVQGSNTNVISTVNFTAANAAQLFNNNPSYAAFGDLADTQPPEGDSFAWGLPFFFGRTVYNSIEGQTVAGQGSSAFLAF